MPDAELDRVLGDCEPAPQELHVGHPQAYRFASPQTAVGQSQYQRPVLAGLVGQPMHVVSG
jgi:hypothetical protein